MVSLGLKVFFCFLFLFFWRVSKRDVVDRKVIWDVSESPVLSLSLTLKKSF